MQANGHNPPHKGVLPTLKRAVLAASQYVGLLGRPWPGLNLPVRVQYGPTPPSARSLLGETEAPDSLPGIHGALSLLCDACTSLEWQIVRRRDPREGTEIITNLPAAQTLADWPLYEKWSWLYSGLLAGNGVAEVTRDGRGAPEKLVVFPAPRVAFRLYDNGKLNLLLVPPTMGQAREVPHTACAHLKYRPVGYDERIGISPVLLASGTIDLLLQHRRMVQSTMRNASRPSGYLTTDHKIDTHQAELVRERWDRIHGGTGTGGTAVLEEGLKYETVQLNDLQALAHEATARMGIGDCARLYGIPPSLLLGTEQNRATATEDRRRLLNFAVAPLSRLCEDALGAALLTTEQRHQGYSAHLDTSELMLGQGVELAETVSKLLNSGAVSLNEARRRLGLAAVPNGDILRSPTNTWPLAAWAEATPASGSGNEGNGEASIRAALNGHHAGHATLKLLTNDWKLDQER
jgi:HK97 family phage portal protein